MFCQMMASLARAQQASVDFHVQNPQGARRYQLLKLTELQNVPWAAVASSCCDAQPNSLASCTNCSSV